MSDRRVVLSSAEYRVVTDRYSGYEAQYRTRWWPFWRIISSGNTSSTLDEAARQFTEQVFMPALKAPRGVRRLRTLLDNWLTWPTRARACAS